MGKKKNVLTVSPISSLAKKRFKEKMDQLHTCRIDNETPSHYFLCSTNKNYFFVMQKSNDPHWEISK